MIIDKQVISFYPAGGREKMEKALQDAPIWRSLPQEEQRANKDKRPRPPFNRIGYKRFYSLRDVYEYIKDPERITVKSWDRTSKEKRLKSLTEEIRTARERDKKEYDLKKHCLLDHVLFSGVPRDDENRIKARKDTFVRERSGVIFSQYIVLDIDHISQMDVSLEALKNALLADGELGLKLLFTSPSGDGLKLVCAVKNTVDSPESHLREYKALYGYLTDLMTRTFPKFELDKTGKDISRTCFLCYDSEAVLVDDDLEFDSDLHPFEESKASKEEFVKVYRPREYSSPSLFGDDGLEEIVRRVVESGKDIAPDYETYFPLVGAFWSLEDKERGRSLLHQVCSLSPKYSELDTDFDFDYNCTYGNIGYFINLCKESGIDVSSPKATNKPQTMTSVQTTNEEEKVLQRAEKEPLSESIKDSIFAERYITPEQGFLRATFANYEENYKTPFSLSDKTPLSIPLEGLTFVCGLPSHGKSVFLRNLALTFSQDSREGDVLYFLYEESKQRAYLQFVNTLADVELPEANLEYIAKYLGGRVPGRPELEKAVSQFESLVCSGKLRIYDKGDTSESLVSFVTEYKNKFLRPVKAVFVDYAQLVESGKNKDRRLDLAEVAKDLNKFSRDEKVPVILACQFNRDIKSPFDMSLQKIGESQGLSQYTELAFGLFDSAHLLDIPEDRQESAKILSSDRGFHLGEPGELYLRVIKNKNFGSVGVDAVLQFNSKTGVLSQAPVKPAQDVTQDVIKGIRGTKTIK